MKPSAQFKDFKRRAERDHGDNLDLLQVMAAEQFLPYFGVNTVRLRVSSRDGTFVRTGRVGVTTGWRPALLLVHRSSDHGSWDILGADDEIVAVKWSGSRSYRPLRETHRVER